MGRTYATYVNRHHYPHRTGVCDRQPSGPRQEPRTIYPMVIYFDARCQTGYDARASSGVYASDAIHQPQTFRLEVIADGALVVENHGRAFVRSKGRPFGHATVTRLAVPRECGPRTPHSAGK